MAEKDEGNDKSKMKLQPFQQPPMNEYVVYVVAVTSMKVKCRTPEEAARHGGERVRELLQGADRNVYIPKAAVVEAGDDEEVKENLAKGVAPWLNQE